MSTNHLPTLLNPMQRGPRRGPAIAAVNKWMKPVLPLRGMRALAVGGAMALGGAVQAVDVDFEQTAYNVAPGEPVQLRVMIDYEDHVPRSLFSYGLRLTSSPEAGVTVSGIEVPPELDFNISTGAAAKDLTPDIWSVKGHVALAAPPTYYTGTLLATYTVQFTQPGTYTLGLVVNQTQGSSESVFVDGDGNTLDGELTPMGTTQVVVGQLSAPVLTITRPSAPAGAVDLKFQTSDQVTYTLKTSTNLRTWSDLTTIAGDGTVRTYRHLGGGGDRHRFYQVVASFGAGP